MKFIYLTALLTHLLVSLGYAEDTYFWDGDRKIYLTLLDRPSSESADTARYRTLDGAIVGITNKLILKLSADFAIQPFLDAFQLTLVKTLGEHTFLLETVSHEETVRVSRVLACQNGVNYAHPDFISHSEPR